MTMIIKMKQGKKQTKPNKTRKKNNQNKTYVKNVFLLNLNSICDIHNVGLMERQHLKITKYIYKRETMNHHHSLRFSIEMRESTKFHCQTGRFNDESMPKTNKKTCVDTIKSSLCWNLPYAVFHFLSNVRFRLGTIFTIKLLKSTNGFFPFICIDFCERNACSENIVCHTIPSSELCKKERETFIHVS